MRRLLVCMVLVLVAGCGGGDATTSTDPSGPASTPTSVASETSSPSETSNTSTATTSTMTEMSTTSTVTTSTTVLATSTTSTSVADPDPSPIRLLATGFDIVSFGTDASVALAELEAVLGPPSNELEPVGEDVVREARWDDLDLTVILQFDDGAETFAGWVHEGDGTPLYTERGLTVGDSVGDLFAMYGAEAGAVQHLDPNECGPEWSIIIDDPDSDQIIRAVLDGPDDGSVVTRLEAGTVFWC